MTPLETLKAARQLISDPAKWTQRFMARDADKHPTYVGSKSADCWCSMGAICHVVGGLCQSDGEAALAALGATIGGKNVVRFNDTHTHAEVLALFDAAIAELEGV